MKYHYGQVVNASDWNIKVDSVEQIRSISDDNLGIIFVIFS